MAAVITDVENAGGFISMIDRLKAKQNATDPAVKISSCHSME